MGCVLVGVLANAAATGALSGPHDRYQARIAWLLPLAGLLAWPATAARRATEPDVAKGACAARPRATGSTVP